MLVKSSQRWVRSNTIRQCGSVLGRRRCHLPEVGGIYSAFLGLPGVTVGCSGLLASLDFFLNPRLPSITALVTSAHTSSQYCQVVRSALIHGHVASLSASSPRVLANPPAQTLPKVSPACSLPSTCARGLFKVAAPSQLLLCGSGRRQRAIHCSPLLRYHIFRAVECDHTRPVKFCALAGHRSTFHLFPLRLAPRPEPHPHSQPHHRLPPATSSTPSLTYIWCRACASTPEILPRSLILCCCARFD